MGITFITAIVMVVGLVLLARGASKVKRDWEETPVGRAVDKTILHTYPRRGSMFYALITTAEWLMDIGMSLTLPIAAGWALDPYSGPFVGAVIGVMITIFRWRWRDTFEQKLEIRRKQLRRSRPRRRKTRRIRS